MLEKDFSTDFDQTVTSLQIMGKEIRRAEGGQNEGLKTVLHTREKDVTYKKLRYDFGAIIFYVVKIVQPNFSVLD